MARASSGSSDDVVPSYVPAAYRSWIASAAAGSGIPASVVAAQIRVESDFSPGVTSPAGAEGLAQFLPSTYAAEGGTGSEYVAANELNPYIRFMGGLMRQYKGNVRDALAAYNAGPGDLQAGYGYADQILSAAGQPESLTGGTGTGAPAAGGGGGILSWPSDITGFFTDADHALGTASAIALAFFQPSTYVRIAVGSLAVILLVLGFYALSRAVKA
jgi:Transglycosylase SLT domain